MNNKNKDTEPITAEKIQNNYPQITLVSETSTKLVENSSNDCTPKAPTLIPTKIPVTTSSVTKQTIPNIKKTSPAVDKKIPPYVNALPQDPLRASKIPAQKPTFVKTPPKATSEKGTGTIESAITTLQPSPARTPAIGDVKKSLNTLPVRTSIPVTISKSADKGVVSSTTTPIDESNTTSVSEGELKNVEKATPVLPTRSPQIHSRTSDVLEKNIQSNILTVTSRPMNRSSPAIVKVVPSKDTKMTETNTVASAVSILKSPATSPSTPKSTPPKTQILPSALCKGIPKSVSFQNVESPRVVNVSRVVVATNSSPKSDAANSKPQTAETVLKPPSKVVLVTSADTSVRTKSPSISVPSSPKVQTYESISAPLASNIKPAKSNVASSNFEIMSLSEVQTNEDIIKAINSGSTASVGKNVTISSASVENASSTSDTKIRNVSSETTIETIAKQVNNPGSPVQKNKNGNPTEGVGQFSKQDSPPNSRASSPGESLTPKRNEIPGLNEKVENLIEIMTPLKKKIDEPVECLTISSDEETEPDQLVSSDHSEVSFSILNKEPPIERSGDASNRFSNGDELQEEVETLLEATSGNGFLNLICRTVRIGSYKIIPKNGVTLSEYGLKIVVPPLNNSNDSVAVKVPIFDIVKVLVHYNRSLPVIFYYITPQAGAKIRQILKMNDPNSYYFDPNSSDESHRRITLLPDKFSDEDKRAIKNYYMQRDVIEELTHTEANQLLVRSAPQDIQKTVRLPPNPVQTIMVYPPPPAKGGISINTEDYSCLAEDTYLNDVIIDFYLKYLYHEKLDEEDRQKTHIFSSFFYKRLTDKATPVPRMLQNSKSSDVTITPAEIRHDRVKKWTKNIDIFSKDYIVIPLNENQHWFLAIICFPGLTGPVRFSDNTPIDLESSKKTEATISENSKSNESEPDSSQTRRIGSTTITPVRKEAYTVADEDGDIEDRDEASGADEDVDELFTSDEDTDELCSDPEPGEVGAEVTPKKKPEREPIKQPCILIFDSLKSASRARIIATLREYLHVEYKTKHNGEERDFSKNVVKGACPRVPQQTNYTDCGLYVLQYVEMFFESKITDFHIPIRTLSRWFDPEIVSRKRYFIQRLLLQLMEDQKINVNALQLPELHLSPDHYSHQYDTDEMDYEDGYYDDEEDEESSNLGHLVGYDEEEMSMSEQEYRLRQRLEAEGIECMDEDEIGMHSRYSRFDSGDDSSSDDNFSDDDDEDDMYGDLDEVPHMVRNRQRRTLINVTRCGDGPDDEEILQEEEEEVEEEEAVVSVDEDELKLNNLNKETVTISRMPASSSVVVKATQSDEAKNSNTLEQLMNARPWKKLNEVSIERATEEDCPSKKFKTN